MTKDRPAPPLIVTRLSVMMLLEYATLGLWAVTVGSYINANTGEAGAGTFGPGFIGLAGTAGAIGALVSPVVMGVVADRYFSTEKLLALLHLVCGGCLWLMLAARSESVFYLALLLYFQAYVPSATLTSSLALRNLPDADRQFAVVRAFGTVGWVAAGVLIGLLCPLLLGRSIETGLTPLWIAVAAHGVMAAYCLTLPPTPAAGGPKTGWRKLIGGTGMWKNRPFIIFLAVSALAAAPTQFYNSFANPFLNQIGFQHTAAKMALGQAVEVACLLALPALMLRYSIKSLFIAGVLAWAVRYALLAECGSASTWLAYPAILVHGACFAFVYMTGQLYADRVADHDARSAAQGLHALVTGGLGHLAGAFASQWAQATYLTPPGVEPIYNWRFFWWLPASASLLAAILIALLFEERPGAKGHPDDVGHSDVA
ncbi:MAG: MFS transporter [Planctomycetota bacterium]